MAIEVSEKYVVFTTKSIMGSNTLGLVKHNFKGFVSNYFNSEREAIEALVRDEETYQDFFIIKQVFLHQD